MGLSASLRQDMYDPVQVWCVNSAIIISILNNNNNCVRYIVLQCEIVL